MARIQDRQLTKPTSSRNGFQSHCLSSRLRFNEPEARSTADVTFYAIIERQFATNNLCDLFGSELRQNQEIRNIDAELVSAPPTTGMACQSRRKSPWSTNRLGLLDSGFVRPSATHPDVQEPSLIPDRVDTCCRLRDSLYGPVREPKQRSM